MHKSLVTLGLILSSGCSGDKTTDATGPTGPTGVAAATFTEVRDQILVPSCGASSCHGAGAGGLQLDDTTTPADLVDVPSTVAAGAILVVAGDPAASYLLQKLEADPAAVEGSLMPPPFGGLDPASIERVREWIAAGALDD